MRAITATRRWWDIEAQVGTSYARDKRYWHRCERCGIEHQVSSRRITPLCRDCKDLKRYEAKISEAAA